jgi:hypothetical protein
MPDAHRRRVKTFCTLVQQGQYRLLSCHVRDKVVLVEWDLERGF